MSNELKTLDLENFANGVAFELFDREIQEVIKNIDDPNTTAKAKRQITLTFTVEPDARRETATLTVEAKNKLQPVGSAIGMGYFGRRDGRLAMYGHDVNQMELDMNTVPTINEHQARGGK